MTQSAPVKSIPDFFAVLTSNGVLPRAFLISLGVCALLTLINNNYNPVYVPMLILQWLTPFLVISVSQTVAIRAAMKSRFQPVQTGPLTDQTTIRRGIFERATMISVVVGFSLSTVVAALNVSSGNGDASVDTFIILQGFGFPFLFSLASQTIAFKRTTKRLLSAPTDSQ